jgi:hypothetical protein
MKGRVRWKSIGGTDVHSVQRTVAEESVTGARIGKFIAGGSGISERAIGSEVDETLTLDHLLQTKIRAIFRRRSVWDYRT